MLNTERNTKSMEKRIRSAAWKHFKGYQINRRPVRRMDLWTVFEHGQWWIEHKPTGAQWSVVDTSNGFDFEQVTEGEEY